MIDLVELARTERVIRLTGTVTLDAPLVVSTKLTIEGGTIRGSRGKAVIVVGPRGALTLTRVEVERTGKKPGSVIDCAGTLIARRCTVIGGVEVSKKLNDGAGVLARGRAKVTIADCTFTQRGTIGVAAGDRTVMTVERSRFHGSFCAVEATESARVTVVGILADKTPIGIAFTGKTTGAARDNRLIGNSNSLHASGTSKPVFQRNRCEASKLLAITISGKARPQVIENVVVRSKDHGISISESAVAIVRGNRVERCARSGVIVYDRATAVIRDNVIANNTWSGIVVQGRGTARATGNECTGNTSSGISINANGVAWLTRNYCRSNKQHGIFASDRARATLVANTSSANGYSGVGLIERAVARLDTDRCFGNKDSGVFANQRVELHLRNTLLDDNRGPGIQLFDRVRVTSKGNRFVDNDGVGIAVHNRVSGTFVGDTSAENEDGISIEDTATPRLTKVTVTNNEDYGIIVRNAAAPRISRSKVASNERSGIYVRDAARPELTGNTCEDNGEEGIEYGWRSRGTARGNTCRRNEGSGIRLIGPVTPTVIGNTCTDNDDRGIAFDEDVDDKVPKATVSGNTMRGNGSEDGIGLKPSWGTHLERLFRASPVAPFLRPAYTPTLAAGAGDSQLGGTPLLPRGESWPVCSHCAKPMPLFLQLDLAKLPRRARRGNGLLQLFFCTNKKAQCSDHGDAHVLRVIAKPGTKRATAIAAAFPPNKIIGWREYAEVIRWLALDQNKRVAVTRSITNKGFRYFDGDETRGSSSSRGNDLSPELGDKLLGWPCWIQEPPKMTCTRCRAPLEQVFQIDSEHGVPFMWGDSGCAYILGCPTHHDELELEWQCF